MNPPTVGRVLSYCVEGWGDVVAGGEEHDGSQEEPQEESQQPDRKVPLDHISTICRGDKHTFIPP